MTKPIEQMTVGELRSYAYLAGEVNKDLGHAHPLRWLARQAFDELARRLAEAEAILESIREWTRRHGNPKADMEKLQAEIERMKPVVEAAIKTKAKHSPCECRVCLAVIGYEEGK